MLGNNEQPISRTQASAMLKQYGKDLEKLSQGPAFLQGRRCASTILSALNSIVYDSKEFVNSSTRTNDPSEAIRDLANSKDLETIVHLEKTVTKTITLDLVEFRNDAAGITSEIKRQGEVVSTFFEEDAKILIADICGKCKSAEDFSNRIGMAFNFYFQDSDLKDNPKITEGIKSIKQAALGVFEEYQQDKGQMDIFDKIIDAIKSVFEMDIDSKFIESASAVLTQETSKVLGKHTAAVLEGRGGQGQGNGVGV